MAKYDMDTRGHVILDDPAAVAVLEKYLPKELVHHPMIAMAKKHRICTLYKHHRLANISTETADKILAEIFALE